MFLLTQASVLSVHKKGKQWSQGTLLHLTELKNITVEHEINQQLAVVGGHFKRNINFLHGDVSSANLHGFDSSYTLTVLLQ